MGQGDPASQIHRLAPSWHPWTWLAYGLIAGGVIWLWRRPPANTAPGFAWRWSLTIVLLWGGLATLWSPALDHGMRYRETFAPLRPVFADIRAQGGCVASMGLGEPQRALLDYYADYHTLRLESSPQAGQCQWLLVQTLHDQLPAFAATLTPLRSFQRPGDVKERFRLYRLEQPLERCRPRQIIPIDLISYEIVTLSHNFPNIH